MNNDSRWSQIEKRLNLQSLGAFIRHGADTFVDKHNFSDRMKTAYTELQEYVESVCGKEQAEDILTHVSDYSGTRDEIYFSLGMKAGAQLIIQLTNNFETDF